LRAFFGAADERGPVSAEDEPRLEVEELLDEMMESWFSPVGDPLSPMTPFGERLQIMKEAEERVLSKREEDFRKAEELERSMEEQPITEEVHGDAREEVERDFMEDYPDLEDAALAVGSADDSAPRFAAAIDGATDITEDDVSDGTVIQFTDSNGQRQQWVYDGRDDTLFRDTTFPSGQ